MARENRADTEPELGSILERTLERALVAALRTPAVNRELARIVRIEIEHVAEDLVSFGKRGRTISVAEASRFAGVTEGTIRDWIAKRRLHALKAGNRYRIRLEDLEQCMTDRNKPDKINIEEEVSRVLAIDRGKQAKKQAVKERK